VDNLFSRASLHCFHPRAFLCEARSLDIPALSPPPPLFGSGGEPFLRVGFGLFHVLFLEGLATTNQPVAPLNSVSLSLLPPVVVVFDLFSSVSPSFAVVICLVSFFSRVLLFSSFWLSHLTHSPTGVFLPTLVFTSLVLADRAFSWYYFPGQNPRPDPFSFLFSCVSLICSFCRLCGLFLREDPGPSFLLGVSFFLFLPWQL